MGSVSELKTKLADVPGIDTLDVTFGAGLQHITINGRTVTVGVNASIEDIRAEFRAALNLSKIGAITTSKPTMASVTGAGHAGQSLKQMMADRKAKLTAAHEKLATNFGKLDQATAALDSLGDDVGNEAADLLASIGQFKNDLG